MENNIEVSYSVFSNSGIYRVIENNYDFKIDEVRLFHSGSNDIYEIWTQGIRYFFRVYNISYHDVTMIEAELKIVERCVKNDIFTAPPIKTKWNDYIITINAAEGIRYGVLFYEAMGEFIVEPNSKQCESMGETISKFHSLHFESLKLARNHYSFCELIDEPLILLEKYDSVHGEDIERLKQITKDIKDKLEKYQNCSSMIIIHGDMQPENVRFTSKDITLFNFETCGYGYQNYDIAIFKWYLYASTTLSNNEKNERFEAFLKGYQKNISLQDDDKKAIDLFVALRELWYLGLQLKLTVKRQGIDKVNERSFEFSYDFILKWLTKIA